MGMRHYQGETRGKKTEMFIFDDAESMNQYAIADCFEGGRAQFVGRDVGANWKEVQETSHALWQEGMDVLNAFVERLKDAEIPEIKDTRRQTKYAEHEGDEVDYEKLIMGEAFWRKSEREEKTGPVEVTVVIDTTTPAHKDSDDILWRGAAAIALTKVLEEKGYRVELWVVNGSELFAGESTGVMTACCLKKTSDPLDTSTLVNVVSGWFYRSAIFTVLRSICTKRDKGVEWGLGRCYSPRPGDLDQISRDANRIYSTGCFSFSAALDMIQAEVARIVRDNPTEADS